MATDADMLTSSEQTALELTATLTQLMQSQVIAVEPTRDGDIREFFGHIHCIQHMIMAQAAARAYPDRYRLLGGTI